MSLYSAFFCCLANSSITLWTCTESQKSGQNHKKSGVITESQKSGQNHKNSGVIRAIFHKCPDIRAYPDLSWRLSNTADILGWSTNSQPFSLFGSDLDQVQNSGPYWSDCRVWKYLFLAILVQFLLLENPRLASIHQCSISAHQSEGKPLEQVPRCHSLITFLDTTPWTFLCTAAAATVERM